MGYAPTTPDRLTVSCAPRLACIPPATAEKIQRLSLNIEITLKTPYDLIRSIAMGDLTKLKSLRTLELFLVLGDVGVRAPRWVHQRDSTWRNAPLLVGLVCGILAQVPSHIEVVWLSTVADIDGCNFVGELDGDLLQIAQTYGGIKGCQCALDSSTSMIG